MQEPHHVTKFDFWRMRALWWSAVVCLSRNPRPVLPGVKAWVFARYVPERFASFYLGRRIHFQRCKTPRSAYCSGWKIRPRGTGPVFDVSRLAGASKIQSAYPI